MEMIDKVRDATEFLSKKGFKNSKAGIILGTGLGALAHEIEAETIIDYSEIPHFPIATVEFHHGKLIYGKLEDKSVIAMQGRFHYYEGYSMAEVVFPVRVMKELGIEKLLISNAGGSMNLSWNKGELMLLEDHINLQPDSPLRGKEAAAFGQIFTDMSTPYDPEINNQLSRIADEKNIRLNKGVYVSVAGPNLETKAEYRYLKQIGADVVGMSTVPEIIAARHMDIPCFAISVITDMCIPETLQVAKIEKIIAAAARAEPQMTFLIKELIAKQ